MARIDIGIIGCGNISHSYLKGAARSEHVRVKSVADMRMEAAQEKAEEYGVAAVTVDRLLADPDIQIVINLTVPLAHAPVSLQIVEAAKHVYSEKPLVTRHAEAEALMLRGKPSDVGLAGNLWDGKTMSAYLRNKHRVQPGPRQCRRLLREWEFRYRKPRPVIARSDRLKLAAHKKTPPPGQR